MRARVKAPPRYVVSEWRHMRDDDDVQVIDERSAEAAAVEWALREAVARMGGLRMTCWVRGPWGCRQMDVVLGVEATCEMELQAQADAPAH